MSENSHFKFSNWILLAPLLAMLLIWTVFWIEVQFGLNLNEYGIYPRRFSGLKGILFSPFIHGSVEHLYNNTIPLAVLTGFLVYFYRQAALQTLVLGLFISGLLTWLIGRPSYHIGASGIIYVLASFIFFKGVFAKHFRLIALSLVVVFVYGSMIWYIFPVKDNISWEGHLSGFITGFLLALTTKIRVPAEKKYTWEREDYNEEEDPFLKHFDADGNFIEAEMDETPTQEGIKITYHYKKDENR
ncbi:rhomboid family intramembrane serine protease [Flagellimonas hymeniacidonis]|uniref:Rhomboid family intramembrane serine protease n=1 Tax=Flagellimonas hymeniacidonis TaxID=2603628 RepID=A0A5C8V065_9FLAO|nr:rhomboid family intramembrane serine protease [Flagellimonas hymeniacidonis]TXN34781.1 rhomboid family intramembrane serine protease [Flagellimonas hymeniacidonis]